MAKKETSIIPVERIRQCIYLVRKQEVMLDKDLAWLYGVKPIVLRQQVKRNIERFPSDFMYQLTDKEVTSLLSQNVIPSRKTLGVHNPSSAGSFTFSAGVVLQTLFAQIIPVIAICPGLLVSFKDKK